MTFSLSAHRRRRCLSRGPAKLPSASTAAASLTSCATSTHSSSTSQPRQIHVQSDPLNLDFKTTFPWLSFQSQVTSGVTAGLHRDPRTVHTNLASKLANSCQCSSPQVYTSSKHTLHLPVLLKLTCHSQQASIGIPGLCARTLQASLQMCKTLAGTLHHKCTHLPNAPCICQYCSNDTDLKARASE